MEKDLTTGNITPTDSIYDTARPWQYLSADV